MEKTTIDDVLKVVRAFDEDNGNTCFVGSFIVFDDEAEVIDDRLFAYGLKDIIKIQMDTINEILDEDDEDFINI